MPIARCALASIVIPKSTSKRLDAGAKRDNPAGITPESRIAVADKPVPEAGMHLTGLDEIA